MSRIASRPPYLAASVALVAIVAACGRSGIDGAGRAGRGDGATGGAATSGMTTGGAASGGAGTGGAGTGGTATGGAATGGSGTGGTTLIIPPCDELVQTGALTALPGFPDTLSFRPKLLPLGQGSAAIVRTIAVPGMGPANTSATTVDWTADWPPAATAPVVLSDVPWSIAALSNSDPPRIALLGPSPDSSPGIAFGLVDPVAGDFTQLFVIDPKGWEAVFLAAGEAGRFFAGAAVGTGLATGGSVPHVGWIETSSTPSYTGPVALGCATNWVRAAAVATPGGWLMARTVFKDDCKSGGPLVTITRYDGITPSPVAELPGDPHSPVYLVPRQGGAWVLYGWVGLSVARLGVLGDVELGPVQLGGGNHASVPDALDGGLVFAEKQGDTQDLMIRVTDDALQIIASAPLAMPSSPAPFLATSDMQVLFDAETRQVLVAVVLPEQEPAGGFGNQVHVARFSCQ